MQSAVAGTSQGVQAAVTGLAKHYGGEIAKQIPVQHAEQKNRQARLSEQAITAQKEALAKAAAQYLQEKNLTVPEGTIKATVEKHSVFNCNAADIEESLISLGTAAHEDNKNRNDAPQAIQRGLAIVLRSTIKQLVLQAVSNAKVGVENKRTTRNNSSNESPNFVPQYGNQNTSQNQDLSQPKNKDKAQNNFTGDGQGPLLSKAGFQVSNTPVINPLVKQSEPESSLVERGLMLLTGSNNSHANSAFATPLFNSGITPLPWQYIGNNTASSNSYLSQILEEGNNDPGREPGLEEYFSQNLKASSPQPLSGYYLKNKIINQNSPENNGYQPYEDEGQENTGYQAYRDDNKRKEGYQVHEGNRDNNYVNPNSHEGKANSNTTTKAGEKVAGNPLGRDVEADKSFFDTLHIYNAVKHLQTGKYKDLNKEADAYDGMHHDHWPSAAAVIRAIELERKEKVSLEERKIIQKNTNAIAITEELHIKYSRTWGGRNTKEQIEMDARDLGAAATKDAETFRKSALRQGYKLNDINQAIERMHKLNRKDGLYK